MRARHWKGNPSGVVPCNHCTICCEGDGEGRSEAIRLYPHEDASHWQTEPHPDPRWPAGTRMLAHQSNGDCIYLERGVGCTIHGRAPYVCQSMDCRNIAAKFPTLADVRAMDGAIPIRLWVRARELLRDAK